VVLLAGLQGAGKTTTAAKLARFLKERQKKKVMTVSADVYRPAAIKQLETVSSEVGVGFIPSQASEKPIDIVNRAIEQAKIQFADVLIVDTAGRLHVDEDMMDEIKELHAAVKPTETLFVVDAMTGQDAANTAKAFNDALPLTGVKCIKKIVTELGVYEVKDGAFHCLERAPGVSVDDIKKATAGKLIIDDNVPEMVF
jgi:signal recognition particle subunit SRP54